MAAAAGTLPVQVSTGAGAQRRVRRVDNRPNIIFVIADDLRYDGLSSTGHPFAQTPNFDRIAREGVKFNNFFCTTPLCSPSRASFLTGLYAHTHGIVNNDDHGLSDISHRLPTFPRILYNAGYETAFIGKWHMGMDDTVRPGFDYWISFRALGLYENCIFNVNGDRQQKRGYTTDFLNQYAVDYIKKPHTRPFVLYLGHKGPHYPHRPASRYENLYHGAEYRFSPVPAHDLQGKRALSRKYPEASHFDLLGATAEPQESWRGRPSDPLDSIRDQARCVASMDDGMGMIFDALEQTGELDNTMLIFTSDHGLLMGEHGIFEEKRWPYDPALRIPLLVRYPKLISPGTARDQYALAIDIAPTLLDLAGVKPYSKIQGKSLLPVFRDADAPLRDSIFCEYFEEKFVPGVPQWQCIRSRRWKYIHYPSLVDMDELYDLQADPEELSNLCSGPSSREVIGQMRPELANAITESQWRMAME